MRTLQTRSAIGFPEGREGWNGSSALYDAHTLRIAGHPVMEDWEAGYMEMLAQICTARGGKVLEVGYGMGLSARFIQRQPIAKHYVIECHPDVVARCVGDFRPAMNEGRLHLLTGFWQDLVPLLADESFDGILFDTYPLNAEEVHINHFPFFRHAHRLLKAGGVLTYYSDEARTLSAAHREQLRQAGFGDDDIDWRICKVNPPLGCEYWEEKTLLAPIVRKSDGLMKLSPEMSS